MRSRALIALALLTLPALAEAQRRRFPAPDRSRPRTAELPPQAPSVGQALAANQQYIRSIAAFESYPMIVAFNTSGNGAFGQSWSSIGMGQHMDLRVLPLFSLTTDLTRTILGGPVQATSFELGSRLGPRRSERGFVPFVDARYGYIATVDGSGIFFNDFGTSGTPQSPIVNQGGTGWGSAVGAGAEFPVTRRFSFTTGVTYSRYNMRPYAVSISDLSQRYTMTSYRTIVALRFNNGRWVNQ